MDSGQTPTSLHFQDRSLITNIQKQVWHFKVFTEDQNFDPSIWYFEAGLQQFFMTCQHSKFYFQHPKIYFLKAVGVKEDMSHDPLLSTHFHSTSFLFTLMSVKKQKNHINCFKFQNKNFRTHLP